MDKIEYRIRLCYGIERSQGSKVRVEGNPAIYLKTLYISSRDEYVGAVALLPADCVPPPEHLQILSTVDFPERILAQGFIALGIHEEVE